MAGALLHALCALGHRDCSLLSFCPKSSRYSCILCAWICLRLPSNSSYQVQSRGKSSPAVGSPIALTGLIFLSVSNAQQSDDELWLNLHWWRVVQDAPCGDFMTHLCCHICANCQEHREIRERSTAVGLPVVVPPYHQSMGVPNSP